MTIQPTLDLHYENHFAFADNAESKGCCWCWKSISKPKEFSINDDFELVPQRRCNYRERIIANQRLGQLIKSKFEDDPIENDEAFEILKKKINDPLKNGDPITSSKLAKIIIAINELKEELNT